jgi:hypothetical protein
MISNYQRKEKNTFYKKNGVQPLPKDDYKDKDFCKKHRSPARLIRSLDIIGCPYCVNEVEKGVKR